MCGPQTSLGGTCECWLKTQNLDPCTEPEGMCALTTPQGFGVQIEVKNLWL